jgi:signal transduction histidine kinase
METRRFRSGLPAADVALALCLLVVKEAFVFTGTLTSGGATAVNVVSAGLLTLPLAWRRRAPFAAAGIIAATIALNDLIAGWNSSVISFDSSIIAAYSAGAYARQRRALAALVALLGANLIDALGAPGNRAGDLALAVVVFSLVPWLVGQALRRERLRTAQLRALTVQLEAERDARTRDAVAVERGRIARELHDIVAHALSVIAIQADAAGKLLRDHPGRAREPLETIQSTARAALDEMRQLVGLLREKGEHAPLGPQPGVADLERLVVDVRHSGLPVSLELTGTVIPLPPTVDLAAFRIVQEGLTNVRKHAGPADAHVTIHYEPDHLEVAIRDNGRTAITTSGGGHGLVGVQERVTLLGGELDAAAAENGGFLLRARLPLVPVSR